MEQKSTVALHDELLTYEGVIEIVIGPYEKFKTIVCKHPKECFFVSQSN